MMFIKIKMIWKYIFSCSFSFVFLFCLPSLSVNEIMAVEIHKKKNRKNNNNNNNNIKSYLESLFVSWFLYFFIFYFIFFSLISCDFFAFWLKAIVFLFWLLLLMLLLFFYLMLLFGSLLRKNNLQYLNVYMEHSIPTRELDTLKILFYFFHKNTKYNKNTTISKSWTFFWLKFLFLSLFCLCCFFCFYFLVISCFLHFFCYFT